MNINSPVLSAKNVNKSFQDGKKSLQIFSDINFSVAAGEHVAIVGPSGSGKSTLLQMLGALESPTSGTVSFLGKPFASMSTKELDAVRNNDLGFVYQFHHLLPELTALENVMLPLLIGGCSQKIAKDKASLVLEKAGLINRLSHRPSKLSGGERQRVAISRAIVNKPKCLLADEPTGNLDPATASEVLELIYSVNEIAPMSLIFVTHDHKLAANFDRVCTLKNGTLL